VSHSIPKLEPDLQQCATCFFGSPQYHLQIVWINDQLARGVANGYALSLMT